MNLKEHISLKSYNTFGIDVKAHQFLRLDREVDAINYFKHHHDASKEMLILGGGSNVLFRQDFEGIVLLNRIMGIEQTSDSEEEVRLKVGAGENWHEFVLYCIEEQYGGIENLSLIPGCVGASPMQNIGAYGTEVKDVITKVFAIEIKSGKRIEFVNHECDFGYRSSIFKTTHKNQFLITHVEFKLSKQPTFNTSYGAINAELQKQGVDEHNINLKAVSDAVISIRSSKLPDPKEIGNAGSFFKNPIIDHTSFEALSKRMPDMPYYEALNGVKLAAGWLIEQAGWKGYTRNNHGVHQKQALVLVNYEDASGTDIYKLSQDILDDVYQKFGIQLEREVNIV